MMDEWETPALSRCTTDEERTDVKIGMERRRRKFQAFATATMKIEAEPDRAFEIAYERNREVCQLTAVFLTSHVGPGEDILFGTLGSPA